MMISPLSGPSINTVVPGLITPTGRLSGYFSNNSLVNGIQVTITVDSVGPYVFTTSARGNRSINFSTVVLNNFSPQNTNCSNSGSNSWLKLGSTKHISAKDGVEIHTVALDSSNVLNNTLKSCKCSLSI